MKFENNKYFDTKITFHFHYDLLKAMVFEDVTKLLSKCGIGKMIDH